MLRFVSRAPAVRLCTRRMSTAKNPHPATPEGVNNTADLCDVYVTAPVDEVKEGKGVQIMTPIFRDLGGRIKFSGPASTVKCHESNPNVRKALQEPGKGRVLVVDAGGSIRCAVFGDKMASLGVDNGWAGVVINGCIRDSADVAAMDLGVKAIGTHPLKSSKRDPGLRDVPVIVGNALVNPGDWIYADSDGVLVAPFELTVEGK